MKYDPINSFLEDSLKEQIGEEVEWGVILIKLSDSEEPISLNLFSSDPQIREMTKGILISLSSLYF